MTMGNLRQGPTRREDRRELARHTSQLLGTLGSDPAIVADTLASAGVKGEPADARQCALAVFFRAVMAGDPRVSAVRVFHDRLVIATPARFFTRRVGVPLPSSVRAFIAGFDARHYPELLRGAEEDPATATRPASGQPAGSSSGLS
jgi:hypothetical protein